MKNEIRPNAVYSTKEVEKLLAVEARALVKLRNNGLLHATLIGNKFRYLGSDIIKFLNNR